MRMLSDITGFSSPNHAHHYLYNACMGVMHRCNDKHHPRFTDYGLRGIECKFESVEVMSLWILNNLGDRPTGHSLDRSDNNGHYEPGNLKWSTAKEQSNNRRSFPTNTGERGISYIASLNKYRVCIGSKRIGDKGSLTEAISLRNSKEIS